jgi:hypothetical protein
MKLPIPFLQSKKEESDYYLSLILSDEKVGAVILKAVDGSLKKINAHEAFLPEILEEISEDDLIASVDKAISRAEEILPPEVQTHQTVFGVKDVWVDEETKKIKKEYLEKLKKVCNALDLTPIGFMVTTEAITHLMQDEEGAPVSAVFAEIGKKEIILSLLRGGKVIESVSSPHLESTPATVDKLLGHFTVPVLPARIVIFQSKPNEHTHHAFMSHHWSKHLPFLHMPQVTVLPEQFDMRSVMYGAAQQMGFKVIEEKHEELPALPKRVAQEEFAEAQQEESSLQSDNLAEVPGQPPVDFGQSENASTASLESAEEKSPDQEEADAATASDFGFVVNEDIAEQQAHVHEEDLDVSHHGMHDESEADMEEDASPRHRHSGEGRQLPLIGSLSSLKLPKNFKIPAVSGLLSGIKGKNAPVKFIIPVVVLIVLIIGVILFYYNVMKANVVLTLKPNMVSQDEKVTFSTGDNNDFANNLISAKSVSTSINGQVSTSATGKKDVGDKAKGSVTIYNNNNNSVTLNSGSTITANSGQVFTLDNDVKVASASGDIFSGTKPGTTTASVTARDIGTDGNVPSGTEFSIGSDNTVAAKNDNAFSGGTKKTVTVVSSNDIAKLRSDLGKSVQDQAKQKLSQSASSDEAVLPLVSDPTLENEKFNHHVNDQASTVSLTADVVFTGMAYLKSDLDDYAKSIAKQKYPQDSNVANKSVQETINDVSQRTKNAATATVSIEAGLLPNLDQQDIVSNIQHKSVGEAKSSLSGLPQVADANITFSPPIPFLPLLFPSLPHKINVSITSQ